MWMPVARADNGTVVSGNVIAIDVANQIMRVYVTAVDGQSLFGGPDTNYVDYLVSQNTVVLGGNGQLINQSNVVIGSRIQMQFNGAYASRVLILGYNNVGNNYSYVSTNQYYPNTIVQNNLPVQSYSSYRQVSHYQPIVQHIALPLRNYNHHLPSHSTSNLHSPDHLHKQGQIHVGNAAHMHAATIHFK